MRMPRLAPGAAATLLLVAAWCPAAGAASLGKQLNNLPRQIVQVGSGGTTFDVFSPALVALAARGVDFPQASTTPGDLFRYNPEMGVFDRSFDLGPIFLERASTTGAGRLNLGASYLFGNLKNLDGEAIEGDSFRFVAFSAAQFSSGTERLDEFRLNVNVWSVTGTYGITDRWDVNAVLPVIFTAMDVDAAVSGFGSASFDDSKLNIGDVLLRTKYRFFEDDVADLAAGLVLRLPSGNEDNFQGLGDVTVTPLFIASRNLGPVGLHLNLGVEANASEVDNSLARYGIGAAWQVIEQLAVMVEIIGSSGFTDTTVDTDVSLGTSSALSARALQQTISQELRQPVSVSKSGSNATIGLELARQDIVDAAVGIKFNIPGGLVGFVSAILPLTEDGVRANVVPTCGLSYSF